MLNEAYDCATGKNETYFFTNRFTDTPDSVSTRMMYIPDA